MHAIETEALSKRFGDVHALNNVTVQVPAGGVVGLVGPNGSGKSTLLRILLGLLRPSAGAASVLGHDLASPSRYLNRVGALIEGPAFVPALSAWANLTSLAQLRGIPRGRVGEVLQLVGLDGRDTEPVRRFSLGMKQRLGIAAAMLPDPELLILDEPTNGLDPAGIVEIRTLLRDLGSSGRTVIVSSHQLAELETVCDRLIVIRFGDVLFSGPTSDLLARGQAAVLVSAEVAGETPRLAEVLATAGWTVEAAARGVRVNADPGNAATINRAASAAGITLATLIPEYPSLESIFLSLTGDDDQQLAQRRAATKRAA